MATIYRLAMVAIPLTRISARLASQGLCSWHRVGGRACSSWSVIAAWPGPSLAAQSPRDGQHDFDFHIVILSSSSLPGSVTHCSGDTTRPHYTGTTVVRKVWNGLANLVALKRRGRRAASRRRASGRTTPPPGSGASTSGTLPAEPPANPRSVSSATDGPSSSPRSPSASAPSWCASSSSPSPVPAGSSSRSPTTGAGPGSSTGSPPTCGCGAAPVRHPERATVTVDDNSPGR